MTVHKLTTHGMRHTKCRLNIPWNVKPTATTWNDGDGETDDCVVCYGAPETNAAPVASVSGFQRFSIVAEDGDKRLNVGSAITNRDRSISLHITAIPMGSKLRLVPT
jgi:hypothetical protein